MAHQPQLDFATAASRAAIRRLIIGILFGCALALTSGCFAFRPPALAYRNIDQTTPDFKAAVAREIEHLEAKGTSPREAEKYATRRILYRFREAEKERRLQSVEPLQAAILAFERPTDGCWAYTVSTTWTRDATTNTRVETFDPYQPETLCWTLVSLNGREPAAAEQARYRADKMRAWKKSRAAPPLKNRVDLHAIASEIEITWNPKGERIYAFTDLPGAPLRSHRTFTVEPQDNIVLRETSQVLKPMSVLTMKIHEMHEEKEYIQLEPQSPPFVSRIKYKIHMTAAGVFGGAVEGEVVYSDYRRVKCYDDRVNVRIGPPTFIDYKSGL